MGLLERSAGEFQESVLELDGLGREGGDAVAAGDEQLDEEVVAVLAWGEVDEELPLLARDAGDARVGAEAVGGGIRVRAFLEADGDALPAADAGQGVVEGPGVDEAALLDDPDGRGHLAEFGEDV